MGTRGHLGQLVAFTQQLVLGFLRQSQRLDPAPVILRFLDRVVPFAQFCGDHLELLAQIVFLLVLIDLLMHTVVYILLQFQDAALPHQHRDQQFRAFFNRNGIKNLLLVLHG